MLGVQNVKNNGNKNTAFSPEIYSKYGYTNGDENAIDRTRLGFSMFSGLLKVTITPLIPGGFEGDKNIALSIHLSVPKAYMLLKEIEKYEEDKATGVNTNFFYGVDTPKGLIGINTGEAYGKPDATVLVVRRMKEDGTIDSRYAYEFKENGYYYSIRNFNESDMSFEKVSDPYNKIELEMFKNQLKQYIDAMTYAHAYATVDANKFAENSTYKSLAQIKQHLGIESATRRTGGASDFFRNGGSNSSLPKTSYGSLSDAIDGEDTIEGEVEDVEI